MRVGILSDIHEDAESLAKALRALEKRGADAIVCLGDILGFDILLYRYLSTRDASYCVDAVRANCRSAVAGNHDLFAVRKLPEVNGGFLFPENWYRLDFAERRRLGRDQVMLYEHRELPALLCGGDREYIDSLPSFRVEEFGGLRVMLSHSLFPDWSGSLNWRPGNPWDFQEHFRRLVEGGCRLGFSGHLHPSGIGIATGRRFDVARFRRWQIPADLVQYICPATASGSGRSGFLVLDVGQGTVEAVSLGSRRYRIDCFR
jgi:predicted phosphodiesterase